MLRLPEVSMLRDAALAWVKSHISLPPLQQEFMDHFDEAAGRCTPFSLLFGRELSRNRKPNLVHCFAREFFVFQLTGAAKRDTRPSAGRAERVFNDLKCHSRFPGTADSSGTLRKTVEQWNR